MRRILILWPVALILLAAAWLSGQVAAQGVDPTPTPPIYRYRYYVPFMMRPITTTQEFRRTESWQTWQIISVHQDYQSMLAGAFSGAFEMYPANVAHGATAGNRMYRAEKAFLFFDTSAIPPDADVISATLELAECWSVAAVVPFTVEFYRTPALPPLTNADWLNYGGAPVATLSPAQCGVWGAPITTNVELDPGSIVKGGITRYAVITDRIRLGLAPEWGTSEVVEFKPDLLTVQYVQHPTRR